MGQPTRTNLLGIKWFTLPVLVILLAYGWAAAAKTPQNRSFTEVVAIGERSGILWQDPGDLQSRDLFHGIGGKQHAPPANGYTFVEEDRSDSSPKFVVRDSNGVHWKVKLGPEVRGEVAATRLVWAAGYFPDDDWYLPRLQVKDMPRLTRGKKLVSPEGAIANVRMERVIEGQKKVDSWKWRDEHWADQRAFNGLKVLMALINNWDLKDSNTAIYMRQDPGGKTEYIYAVTDLGASFGPTHIDRHATKVDLEFYEASGFISKVDHEKVRFATPGSPTPYLLVNLKHYFYRRGLTSLTRRVPRDDARWMGQLLSRLSKQQLRDAFLAAGFSTGETDRFARIVENRIELLRQL